MAHDHGPHNHNQSQNNIKIAFLLNLAFTILEIVGGLWTNSMAILSDALHDLGDSFSLGIAWYLEKYSQKTSDQKFSYGYARFSLLGALMNSLLLVGGSVFILTQSVPRIFEPEDVNPGGMIIFAVLGIAINGLAVFKLRKGTSFNERIVSWHLLEDVLGWAAIFATGIVLLFINIPVLDPILSVMITVYVLINVVKSLKETLNIFLQGVPKDFSISGIEQEIIEKTGVNAAYHTHIWSLDGERNLFSTHIIVDEEMERKEIIMIKNEIRNLMREKGIEHVTIEVDFKSEKYDY